MKKVLTIVALAFSTVIVAQPTLEWAAPQIDPTSGASTPFAMHKDASGNIISVGSFSGTIDFDPGSGVFNLTSSSSIDIYVSKLDPSGNLIWAVNYGALGVIVNEVTGDGLGNIYITGSFSNSADFDPGSGVANLTSNGNLDAYVLKLDAMGSFQWAESFGDANTDGGYAIYFDQLNNQLLIGGHFSGNVDFDPSSSGMTTLNSVSSSDAFLLSLTPLGGFQWVKQFGGTSLQLIEDITLDGNGNIYINGLFGGDIDIDPSFNSQILTAAGASDAFVCKLLNSGDLLWGAQLGDAGSTRADAIDVSDDGSVYFGGSFSDDINFTDVNNNTISLTTMGGLDIYMSKLNASGDFIWTKSIGDSGTDRIFEINVHNGFLYMGGEYSGTADFDTGPNTFSLPSAGSGTNACLFALDTSSYFAWAYSIGNLGSALNVDKITDLHVDSQGIYALGHFYGTNSPVDIDPGASTVFNVNGLVGANNAFTIKLQCTPVASTDNVTNSCAYTWIDGNTYTSSNNTATWTLSNQFGCDSIVTLNLTITDNEAPLADAATLTDIIDECEITSLTPTTATDNCAGAITGTHNATLPITSTTTINWTYDDGNGNTSTQTQEVIITSIDNNVTQNNDFPFTADANGYNYQWVDCNDNNAPIAGETNQTFEATANESYAVVIDNGDCSVISDCFDVTTVGINEYQMVDFEVYPNPTIGTIIIHSTSNFNKVEVLNGLGQLIESNETKPINEFQLELPKEAGLYWIRVSSDDRQNITRIIRK